jgi:3',5'-cyclic AMP phosphodiesterase CpdA
VTFLLAHLSDAHIGPLPRPLKRDLIGKRFTGWLNWNRGRSARHDMNVLARIVEDMKAHKPDHIAMTGDILNLGLPTEFPLASAWLNTLGAPEDVSFVPGNHDAYVRGSMPHLVRTFAPWTEQCGDGLASFPYLRVRGDVALIGLSSGLPTAPLIASGRLGFEQLQKFAKLLDETRGLARVVMIHHPPYKLGSTPGRRLTDARAFESILAHHGAELVIHGHNHRRMLASLPSPGGPTPVVGAASASAVPGSLRHRAAWNLYCIDRRGDGWFIEMRTRGLLPDSREIGELERACISPDRPA